MGSKWSDEPCQLLSYVLWVYQLYLSQLKCNLFLSKGQRKRGGIFKKTLAIILVNFPLKWGVNLVDLALVGAELRLILSAVKHAEQQCVVKFAQHDSISRLREFKQGKTLKGLWSRPVIF